MGLSTGLVAGMCAPNKQGLDPSALRTDFMRLLRLLLGIGALATLVAIVPAVLHYGSLMPALHVGVVFLGDLAQYVVGLVGLMATLWAGGRIGEQVLAPAFRQLFAAGGCLAVVKHAVVGFLTLYACVVGLFGYIFAAIYRLDPNDAFVHVPAQATFWNFLNFSLMNVTALSYSPIVPGPLWVKDIAYLEVAVVGISLLGRQGGSTGIPRYRTAGVDRTRPCAGRRA
jgi:hypothetical protein